MLKNFPDGKEVSKWFYEAAERKVSFIGKKYKVTDYGVTAERPDLLQTEKIQNVIDTAAADGGGTVVFPAGTFRSGSLFFKPGTSLHLEKDAVLQGSREISDFALLQTRMEGENVNYFAALVNADHADGFAISGEGVIDGDGTDYWRHFWLRRKFNPDCTNMDEMRPRLLYVSNSCDVHISGVTLRNSPFWTCHFYRCTRLLLNDLSITAPAEPIPSPSTDAVDLDVCSEVLVKRCCFTVNDDGIALKGGKGPEAHLLPENGGNSDIIIDDCDFGYCHSALTCGSETVHNRNIVMSNCRVDGVSRLLFLKMRPDTTQLNEYVTLHNIKGMCGQVLLTNSWTQFRRCKELYPSAGKNVLLEKLDLNCNEICAVLGAEEYTLENIVYRDSRFVSRDPKPENFAHENAFIFERVEIC